MKASNTAVLGVLVLCFAGLSYGVPPTTISIDGNFSDWDAVSTVIEDASGDTTKPGTDILEFKLAHDSTHLYVSSLHAGPVVSEDAGTGGQGRYYYLVFVDLDNDLGTGFDPAAVDARCYAPSSVGCDWEIIFERDWDDNDEEYELQYAFANGAVAFFQFESVKILEGIMRIAGSHDYRQQVEFKFQNETIPQGIVLTRDLNKNPAPGIGVLMNHAFSEDMTRVELGFDFRAALKDDNGIPNLKLSQTIAVGFACESSPFNPSCGDGIEPVRGYGVEAYPTATPTLTRTRTPTLTLTPTLTPTPTPTIDCVSSATLVVSCTGGIGLSGVPEEFRLRFHAEAPSATECGIAPCQLVSSRFTLLVNCSPYVGVTDTARIQREIIESIGTAIESQSSLRMGWTEVSGVGLSIQSDQPFTVCLCGDEVGVRCNLNEARPLHVCPIYNLCDGVTGNETSDIAEYEGGIGFEWIDGPCPGGVITTPTPTRTPMKAETPTPTLTPTPEPTLGRGELLFNFSLAWFKTFDENLNNAVDLLEWIGRLTRK